MKETLYTIPLNDAVNANDECPFCFIEREVEQGDNDRNGRRRNHSQHLRH